MPQTLILLLLLVFLKYRFKFLITPGPKRPTEARNQEMMKLETAYLNCSHPSGAGGQAQLSSGLIGKKCLAQPTGPLVNHGPFFSLR